MSKRSETADVVIVGAGAAGCAVAYYLTRLGLRPTVVERESVACAASGGALGDLNTMTGAGLDGPLFELARSSLAMHLQLHDALKAEAGIDSKLRLLPSLAVALDDEDENGLRSRMAWQRERGFSALWLDGDEARGLEPRLTPEVRGALLTQGMGMLSAAAFTTGLMQAAERGGATLRHGEVRGVLRDGARATGVALSDGYIAADAVVLALGPWSGALGEWLGTPVPVRPVKGQIVRLRVPSPPAPHYVTWNDTYAVLKEDALTWTGTTMEEAGFDDRPTAEARDDILQRVRRLLPPFDTAEVVAHTACLRPVTSDWLPALGPVPRLRGAYVATGGGRKGILLSPVMGKAVAELVAQGRTDVPIEPFGVERFTV